MKKVLLITAITIALLSSAKTQAQTIVTVSNGNKSINLTKADTAFLNTFHYSHIKFELKTFRVIKYNASADLIIYLMDRYRKFYTPVQLNTPQLIARAK